MDNWQIKMVKKFNCFKNFLFLFLFSFGIGLFQAQKTENLSLNKFKITKLSDNIAENSGLAFWDKHLFTLNDSGNPSEIFEISPESGKILKTINILVPNTDWEALCFSEKDLFIGDFGNNSGTRQDLKIYKIPIDGQSFQTDSLQILPFYFPEQKDFNSRTLHTDFDVEAVIYLHNQIHIFTKEWSSKFTTHYTINPSTTILQPAEKIEKFNLGFVVTDATYFQNKLYLVGYNKKTEAFLMIFEESESGIFFKNTPKKYYLGSTLFISQIEGIAVNENGIFIAGEAFHSPLGTKKQSFYCIPWKVLPLNCGIYK